MKPTMKVPKPPTTKPAFLKAAGIARMPDPRDDFRRWTREPIVLQNDKCKLFTKSVQHWNKTTTMSVKTKSEN